MANKFRFTEFQDLDKTTAEGIENELIEAYLIIKKLHLQLENACGQSAVIVKKTMTIRKKMDELHKEFFCGDE